MKVSLKLRTNRTDKNNKHPVSLCISKGSERKYYSTGVSCHQDEWSSELSLIGPKARSYKSYNKRLQAILERAEEVLVHIEKNGDTFSFRQFDRLFVNDSADITIQEMFQKIITEKQNSGNFGGARVYENAARVFDSYAGGRDFYFDEIDYNWLNNFVNHYLKLGRKKSTPGNYLRSLRAAYNQAVKRQLISDENNPFRSYSIGHLKEPPSPSFLTIEQVKKLRDLKLEPGSADWKAQQYFLFSFFSRGMNFIDMAMLKQANLKLERITYTRSKTQVQSNIAISTDLKTILDAFAHCAPGADGFIFPIFNAQNSQGKRAINHRVQSRKRINARLAKLGREYLGLDFNLTHGMARHTFANALRSKNVQTYFIKELLEHKSERTTQIYLASMGDTLKDEMTSDLLN